MTEKEPTSGFSLESAGKSMPYTVPEGFFTRLQADIIARNAVADPAPERARGRHLSWRAFWSTAAATAAAVAVVMTLTVATPHSQTPDQMSVEQAFSNLSAADQEYIIDTFRNDFIMDY